MHVDRVLFFLLDGLGDISGCNSHVAKTFGNHWNQTKHTLNYVLLFEYCMIAWDVIEIPMNLKSGLSISIHNTSMIFNMEPCSTKGKIHQILKIL